MPRRSTTTVRPALVSAMFTQASVAAATANVGLPGTSVSIATAWLAVSLTLPAASVWRALSVQVPSAKPVRAVWSVAAAIVPLFKASARVTGLCVLSSPSIQASTLAPTSSPESVMSLKAWRSVALMRLSVATAGMPGAAGARVSKAQAPVAADQPDSLPATSTTRARALRSVTPCKPLRACMGKVSTAKPLVTSLASKVVCMLKVWTPPAVQLNWTSNLSLASTPLPKLTRTRALPVLSSATLILSPPAEPARSAVRVLASGATSPSTVGADGALVSTRML